MTSGTLDMRPVADQLRTMDKEKGGKLTITGNLTNNGTITTNNGQPGRRGQYHHSDRHADQQHRRDADYRREQRHVGYGQCGQTRQLGHGDGGDRSDPDT